MKKISNLIGHLLFDIDRLKYFFIRRYVTSRFSKIGKDVYIGKNGIFSYQNISLGNDIYIGANAVFQSSYGKITIGDHVMFGPGVHIHGGNHKIREIGALLKYSTEKKEGEDGLVVIEDDCWIGANAIILANVTIGRGSIVGAGAIVTHSIPPYSIYTGAPALKLRARFSEENLKKHIEALSQTEKKV